MMKRTTTLFLAITLAIVLFALPAMAAVNTINQGNAVFLGEQGLDVSSAVGVDNQIGWWPSGASIYTSSPVQTFSFAGSKTSFAVTPSTFGPYLGTWYRLDSSTKYNGTAFTVTDPLLNLRVEDKSAGVDVTQNKWVYRGDEIGFRVETNLDSISSQRSTAATVTIKVQSPDGGVYSALVNPQGTTNSIENLQITSSPQNMAPTWDTGNSAYSPGTYTIWAECNTNQMKDNYNLVPGKTVSAQTSMRNTEINPLIGVNIQTTVVPTTLVAVIPTTITIATPIFIPTTRPTTPVTNAVITTAPATTAVQSLQPTETVTLVPATTTQMKSPGFDIVVSVIAVSLIAVAVLRKP